MEKTISILKGVHPGAVLERELKKRNLAKGRFALSIDEYPQTIGAIIKGKRNMNAHLSLKIEKALGIEEGYFMVLQAYYEVRREKEKNDSARPDMSKIKRATFWDTDMDTIKWGAQKKAVIKRIFERGNEQEREEITRFYGKGEVVTVLSGINFDPVYRS